VAWYAHCFATTVPAVSHVCIVQCDRQVACDAPAETAELLTVKACRLKFASLDRVMKAAAKLVVAVTPAISASVGDSNSLCPPEVPVLRSAGEISESSSCSVEPVGGTRADAASMTGASIITVMAVKHSKLCIELRERPAAVDPVAETSHAVPALSGGSVCSPTMKPIKELLTSFEAPLFKNYVKAPRLPAMAVCCP
jgi:hypothetical protein